MNQYWNLYSYSVSGSRNCWRLPWSMRLQTIISSSSVPRSAVLFQSTWNPPKTNYCPANSAVLDYCTVHSMRRRVLSIAVHTNQRSMFSYQFVCKRDGSQLLIDRSRTDQKRELPGSSQRRVAWAVRGLWASVYRGLSLRSAGQRTFRGQVRLCPTGPASYY